MPRKFIYLFFLLIPTSAGLFAQELDNIHTIPGPQENLIKDADYLNLIHQDEKYFYFLKGRYYKKWIEKWSLELTKVAEMKTQFDYESDGDKHIFLAPVSFGSQLEAFYFVQNQQQYCFEKINTETLLPDHESSQCIPVEDVSIEFSTKTAFQFSPDYKVMAIYFSAKSGDNQVISILVVDSDHKLRWKKKLRLPYDRKKGIFTELKVYNDGDVILSYLESSKNLLDNAVPHSKSKSTYHIIRIENNGEKETDIPITSDESVFYNSLDFIRKANKDVFLSGYYSKKETYYRALGMFATNIKSTKMSAEAVNITPFSNKTVLCGLNLSTDDKDDLGGKELDKMKKTSLFTLPDNSFIYTGLRFESVASVTPTSSVGSPQAQFGGMNYMVTPGLGPGVVVSSEPTYFVYALILAKLDAEGNKIWDLAIPLKSRGQKTLTSCFYLLIGGKLYIFSQISSTAEVSQPFFIANDFYKSYKKGFLHVIVVDPENGNVLGAKNIDNLASGISYTINQYYAIKNSDEILTFRKEKRGQKIRMVKISLGR